MESSIKNQILNIIESRTYDEIKIIYYVHFFITVNEEDLNEFFNEIIEKIEENDQIIEYSLLYHFLYANKIKIPEIKLLIEKIKDDLSCKEKTWLLYLIKDYDHCMFISIEELKNKIMESNLKKLKKHYRDKELPDFSTKSMQDIEYILFKMKPEKREEFFKVDEILKELC